MREKPRDLLGHPLSPLEQAVVEIHGRLTTLLARNDLSPCIEANARQAQAVMSQILTDLDLDPENLES